MTTQIQNNPVSESRTHGGLVAGMILIGAGILIALGNLNILSGAFLLGALAAIFLVVGLGANRFGLLIPGSILSGLAVGVALVEGPFSQLQDPARGGVFMLALSCSFVLISLFSALLKPQRGLAIGFLIPALVLGLMGTLMTAGGLHLLWLMNYLWPALLVLTGLYLILRRR